MEDFTDGKSADCLYEVGDVFVPWQLCGIFVNEYSMN